LSLVIYLRVGVDIFQKRNALKRLGDGSSQLNTAPVAEPPFTGTRTTEVEVTRGGLWQSNCISRPGASYNRGERHTKSHSYSINITASNANPTSPRGSVIFSRRPGGMDKVKWAYSKVALLFALSILITWVPSSINRIYGVIYPDTPSYSLNICSAIVLPLQGFWNTIIFFTTSQTVWRAYLADFRSKREARAIQMRDLGNRAEPQVDEKDSTRGLSTSRTGSDAHAISNSRPATRDVISDDELSF
jgi:hypothetical protein